MTASDIALCYGTRPQIIKASVLREALGSVGTVLAVDTGQHYDYTLNQLLYEQLDVKPPDLFLEVGSGSHAEQTASILNRLEPILKERKPRATVVIGDTNSTLGCALAAVKLRVPVVHVEAGLRAKDALMAEEINRRAVDAVASVLCTPSAIATRLMVAEHPGSKVVETGDVSYDVLVGRLDRLPDPSSAVPGGLREGYIYATLHRAELTDRPAVLIDLLKAMSRLDRPVVLALHPRTRVVLDAAGWNSPGEGSLTIIPAVGYLESLALTRSADAVITDSGGLQREAYWLGVPCLTMRGETEWAETLTLGANRLVPPLEAPSRLAGTLKEVVARRTGGDTWDRTAYGNGRAAQAVADAVRDLISATR